MDVALDTLAQLGGVLLGAAAAVLLSVAACLLWALVEARIKEVCEVVERIALSMCVKDQRDELRRIIDSECRPAHEGQPAAIVLVDCLAWPVMAWRLSRHLSRALLRGATLHLRHAIGLNVFVMALVLWVANPVFDPLLARSFTRPALLLAAAALLGAVGRLMDWWLRTETGPVVNTFVLILLYGSAFTGFLPVTNLYVDATPPLLYMATSISTIARFFLERRLARPRPAHSS